ASHYPKRAKTKPAVTRSTSQTSRKTWKKFTATAIRGSRQRGNSPRLQRHYRRRTARPDRPANSRTDQGGSGRNRNRSVGGDYSRVGAWSLSHENPSATAASAGVYRAALERRAGAYGDAGHSPPRRADRGPARSDRNPACVRGSAHWGDRVVSGL